MPVPDETLQTRLTVLSQVGGVSLVSAETSVNGRVILVCRMKLATETEDNVL